MQKKSSKKEKILTGISIVVVICLVSCGIYLGTYYHSVNVETDLTTSETVTIKDFEQGIFFDGPGETDALIFYPGAKVDTTAYAPLMHELAENGIDCFLVDMPFHMAFFGINRAETIMKTYTYDSWYLGGHSLGGAMIASFAADHTEQIAGLLLLASYTTKDLSDTDLSVVTVYGSEDGVLNRKSLEKGRKLLPQNAVEKCIKGGNHAQFGSYGKQKGDNEATIPAEEQITQTVSLFLNTIKAKQ